MRLFNPAARRPAGPLVPSLRPRLRRVARRLADILLDRQPARPWVASDGHRRPSALRPDRLSEHLRRDIGFPPGAPFS